MEIVAGLAAAGTGSAGRILLWNDDTPLLKPLNPIELTSTLASTALKANARLTAAIAMGSTGAVSSAWLS